MDGKITRVTGPFCVEGTIPTPVDLEDDVAPASSRPSLLAHVPNAGICSPHARLPLVRFLNKFR